MMRFLDACAWVVSWSAVGAAAVGFSAQHLFFPDASPSVEWLLGDGRLLLVLSGAGALMFGAIALLLRGQPRRRQGGVATRGRLEPVSWPAEPVSWPAEPVGSRAVPELGAAFGPRQLFGIMGCFVLFLGVFAPLISVPISGNMNYFQNGKGDGTIILVLAGLSLIAALNRAYGFLWFTGLASLAMLTFTFVSFRCELSTMKEEMAKELAGNPFRGLVDLAVRSVQMQWGWAVLLAGALMLLISAGMRETPRLVPRQAGDIE